MSTLDSGWRTASVIELQSEGVLLVEDGNHGEHRPRPDEFCEAGIAFIRAADMDSGQVRFGSASRINEIARRRITKGIGAPGDVLLSHKGTVGKVAFVPEGAPRFVCSPQTTLWRSLDSNQLDRRYLFAFLRSRGFHAQLASRAGETDMAPYVSLTSQRGLLVTLPPVETQRAIASVLGALDDKIDLNRRMCQTLEEMARALFKSWFVDFDPVRAKMEGRDPGLPKEIADLFPSRLIDSELGPIPEGWRVGALDAVMDVNPPRALKKAAAAPHLDMGNMPTHGHCACDITERPYGSGARFVTGDTLLARITPCLENGKTAFVDFLPEGVVGWGSTEYIVIRPKPPTPVAMGYYLARTTRFREYAIQSMNGSSGRQRVPSEAVARYRLPIAPEAVTTGFGRMADPLMRRVRQATNESTTLAALRDTLLPKLISGELRVSASLGSMQEVST